MLSTRGRLALLLADMPGKWQEQFLRPGPWPQEFIGAMRETYFRAGPDFQLSKMAPRSLDLGPITALTNLGRLPYFKMTLVWTLFALLLVVVFISARIEPCRTQNHRRRPACLPCPASSMAGGCSFFIRPPCC